MIRAHESTSRTRLEGADRYVGARVRNRRIVLGMTQQKLANQVGITYQQAHSYEKGTARISAQRLDQIAGALGVPIAYFFEEPD